MPVITVTLMEGYDEQTRSELCTRLTNAVTNTIAAPIDGVTVVINEMLRANYMRGRQQCAPGSAKSKTYKAEPKNPSYTSSHSQLDFWKRH